MTDKIVSTLESVPETMLWTLHNRAGEAMREDGILTDPKAVEIYRAIEYDYERSFGKSDASHAVRSKDFDREIEAFLSVHPDGTIVNLGEGLETQRFRFNDTEALWVSVDVPEAIAMREKFIQPDERHVHVPLSATDRGWFDFVPKDKPVFITAQGLFMYFTEGEVRSLLQDMAKTFPQATLMFDTISEFLSRKAMSEKGWMKTKHYRVPPVPWGINRDEMETVFTQWLSDDIEVIDIGYSGFPRGLWKYLLPIFESIPIMKKITPTIVKIRFTKQGV